MISVICIVKLTRSQKPAPNHVAACTGELPMDTAAVKTISTATSASANASGNQRSNHSERRRPASASLDLAGRSWMCISRGRISNVAGDLRQHALEQRRHAFELARADDEVPGGLELLPPGRVEEVLRLVLQRSMGPRRAGDRRPAVELVVRPVVAVLQG